MPRKLLIILLIIALVFELVLTGMCFFTKEAMLNKLGAVLNSDTDFLGYIIAWFCLFVSLICGLALWHVVKNNSGYVPLCYILGLWWIGIGLGIYIVFKKPDNLFTDSLKGLLLISLTWWNAKTRKNVVYKS